MIVFRACALVMALGLLALAVVVLRAEQTRMAAESLSLERRCVAMRRQLWQLRTSVARLRTPQRLQDSLEWFDVGIAWVPADSYQRDGLPPTDGRMVN